MIKDPTPDSLGTNFTLLPVSTEALLDASRPRSPHRTSPQFTAKNAAWLCRLRWLAVTFMTLLGFLTFLHDVMKTFGFRSEYRWSFSVAAILALLNLGYLTHLHWIRSHNRLKQAEGNLRIQILADLLLVTVTIHFLGTTETFAPMLYIFHIVLTCIFFPTKRSFVIVLLSSALYAMALILEQQGFLAPSGGIFLNPQESPTNGALRITTNFTTLFVIWLCVWYLASRLSSDIFRRDRELGKSNEHLLRTQAERTRHMLRTTHELKAPFAAIHANTQLLINGYCGTLSAESLGVIRRIAERSKRLSDSIQNMLQLTNLQSVGKEALKWSTADLADLLRKVMDNLEPLASERGVHVEARLDPIVSYIPEDHFLMLFSNLIQNAIVYSHPGGTVDISCQVSEQRNFATVSIRDHGIGIVSEKLPRIFEEYYRTEEAVAHNKDSSGIGLAIVKTIAQTHGIIIHVHSRQGSGTTFTLNIPLQNSGLSANQARRAERRLNRVLRYLQGENDGLHSDR